MGLKQTRSISNEKKGMGLLFVFFPKHNPRSSNLLLSKAQSTVSICALLFFLTLFLFTISTFEPSSFTSPSHRRFLINRDGIKRTGSTHRFALHGMGTLFLRGTRGMQNLVVAHVTEDTMEDDLRLFLRYGITSISDLVLLFTSHSSISRFGRLIHEENNSFSKLVQLYRNSNSSNRVDSVWGFRFVKKETRTREPLWGKKKKKSSKVGKDPALNENESLVLSHGSVVGFEVSELDPENSLSGFMDHVPMSLRRWACYPMLLGRVRHNFKHVVLVDAKTSLVLSDPFTLVRNRSSDSVLLFSSSKHRKESSNSVVNSAILIGGAKGIRRLSSAMLTEIVRATMQHKKRNSVSDSAVLSQLVGNVHVMKNFQVVIETSESVPEQTSSLIHSSSKNRKIFQRGISKSYY